MKRVQFVKHLIRNGCQLLREGGNHSIFASADRARQTAVPRHSEIKPNLMRKICKDLRITAQVAK